ncbi:RelA/SpoT family protein [Phaeodactylibacter luteus]|uniref:Bifunctional (P)ppGpp synthetase/guanosine-3',5'-bis(Diphosphate) 3'-pyrophosphohydrolase n=1 Tax=Phaeodactylibacter luteus TaxID=1564516 RepID=A0A5C6RMA7_9BACT|nr:bifunctional (p)ppGpp synthetase/guanosine-3',5'-bis(diphosphate) 3'-pyrophosphohydrolase [Phaeodactylibacter luteus]TXB62482.1 bifunctional (p)ppGpp synthetase/guanosine-3',5'-bis(diphosphate) 3'-pyrophosphohydrolase [Phaeodactylibacter luteus]
MAEVLALNENDRQLIQSAYRDLLRAIKVNMSEEDSRNIRAAYELAVQAHAEQRRKSGEPYILHPIAVAKICAEEIGLGPTAIICALLHDVVEDTDVTLEDIREQFGGWMAKIVDGLTKLDSAYNAESPQAENFRKVLSTLVDDVRVVLIKMADRLHNMRTLGAMPRHKQLKIAAETSYIYAPLAHRLGLYKIKTEYLDLCMKITDPDDYREIARKLAETKRARESYINEFIGPLEDNLNALGIEYRITGRPKSIYSIWNKIKKKNVPFEEIYDLFAVRIIVDVPIEKEKLICWQVYSIVTDVHTPIPERLKDWITTPKSNGYESLHTTVVGPKGRFVEVQIRSVRMDEIAERGFAAHWKYKGGSKNPDIYERWLDSVREILEDPETDAVEFLGDFRSNNLFQEEVFVYTPKGDMRILPKGATALDFAFGIHTDVGYHCQAVKVNNKIVPMGYALRNGDQLEVITSSRQKPTEDWLKMVTTGKARAKIRNAMKEERRERGELGREALERKLRPLKVDFEESVERLVRDYDLNSHTDLYYAIATEELSINEIFKTHRVEVATDGSRHLAEIEEVAPQPAVLEDEARKRSRSAKLTDKPRLLINGEPAERFDYSFASCCNPVQGDAIFAYLTSNAGLKIHRSNCPNATNLMVNYGYRVMKAEWISTTNSTFVVNLNITGIDDGPGVIERLTHKISTMLGLNIRSFSIEGDEGYFSGKISLLVRNTDQLYMAVQALKNLDNISTVTRVE